MPFGFHCSNFHTILPIGTTRGTGRLMCVSELVNGLPEDNRDLFSVLLDMLAALVNERVYLLSYHLV
jgi:hypothetical protein